MAETTPRFTWNVTDIDLDYPLALNDPYEAISKRVDSFSVSGEKQTIFDYIDYVKIIDIQFASSATKDSLTTMFTSWAAEGKTIRFAPDKDTPGAYDEVTIVENSFIVQRQTTGTNVFKVKFKIRKNV